MSKPLGSTHKESQRIGLEIIDSIDGEFPYFLKYIHNLEYDKSVPNIPFSSLAKQQVLDLNKTGIELFYSFILEFSDIQSVADHLLCRDTGAKYNLMAQSHKGEKYVSKETIRDLYNDFCIRENLRSNIVRNNREIAQLWVLLGIFEQVTCRFRVKEGPNYGRRMDHVPLGLLDLHIIKRSGDGVEKNE